MKKIIALFTALMLLALCVCTLSTVALADSDVLTLDIANGAITITETGYSIDGGEETAYTGSYIITGSAETTGPYKTLKVNGVASGSKVTLKDLTIITTGEGAIALNAPVEATGKLRVASAASPFSGGNITITGDAEIECIMPNSANIFSCGVLNLTCKSMKLSGGMVAGGSDMSITTTDYCVIEVNTPAFTGANLKLNIGGALDIKSTSNCLNLTKADITAGSIRMETTGAAPTVSVQQVSLTATAGDINLIANGSSPVTNTETLTMNASGNVSAANKGTYMGIIADNLDVTAGGNITVTAPGLAIAGSSGQKQSLKAGGNVTVTSQSNLTISAGDITVSGKDITVQTGSTTSPNIGCQNLDMVAAGNVQLNGGSIAVSAYNDVSVKADGNISITSVGGSPTFSTARVAVKAKGAVTVSNTGYSMISYGDATSIEGSSVTVNAGDGSVVFGGPTDLKATAGDLTINSATTQSPVFGSETNSFYAAEKIVCNITFPALSMEPPEITFGQSFATYINGETVMFFGLDQVAVEGNVDYLPQLYFALEGQKVADAVFTAALDGAEQTQIMAKGVYNCTVGASSMGGTVPFNLIVRPAKPAGNPSTGDSMHTALFGILALASAAAAGSLLLSRKRYSV